ncbi:MAG: response regulator [Chloroflexi bacterium]|nr:response regulator [Chloroflexota bacterium]
MNFVTEKDASVPLGENGSVRVLVVDDEEENRSLMEEMLDIDGYLVKTASHGEEAMGWLKEMPFQVVVTDIMMPDMNGIQLLNCIKEISPQSLVILVTGYATLEKAIAAVKGGASGFLVKPFSGRELRASVQEAIKRKRIEEELVRFRSLATLVEVGQKLSSTLNRDDVAQEVVMAAARELRAQQVSLAALDEGVLRVKAGIGLAPDDLDTPRERGVEGLVALRQETLIVTGAGELPPWAREVARIDEPLACVPLKTQGKVLGVLKVSRGVGGESISPLEIEVLSALASQASIALDNARLFDEIKEKSNQLAEEKLILEKRLAEIAGLNRLFRWQQEKTQDVDRVREKIQALLMDALRALSTAMESRIPRAAGHSHGVAQIAYPFAEIVGLSPEAMMVAAYLHDVGKIRIPTDILLAATPGSPESGLLQQHPLLSVVVMGDLELPDDIVLAIRHHHENYDGSGYPDRLSGENIPLGARLLAVANSYEKLTAGRGQPPLSPQDALEIIVQQTGRWFDPLVVEAFKGVVDSYTKY